MATMVQKCCISISYPSKKVKNGATMVQERCIVLGRGRRGFGIGFGIKCNKSCNMFQNE